MNTPICDYCGYDLHLENGWWVDEDSTSDCPDDNRGHMVDGSASA